MESFSTYRFRITVLAIAMASLRVCGAESKERAVPQPLTINLAPLGYRPVTSAMIQREGYSMVTVDFADDDHVLVTYAERKLVPRLPDHNTDHPDRLIRAVVLHLPDGKIERETEFRSHDLARYLWPLNGGRFIVRVENTLYTMDALHDGPREDKLERKVLLRSASTLESVQTSPSGDLLLIETSQPKHIGDDPHEPKPEFPITAGFYALESTAKDPGEIHTTFRGTAKSRDVFSMTFTSYGVLEAVKEDRQHWGFDFHAFDGATEPLAGFTSTCKPVSFFVSDGEFFSAGCRGGEDRRLLAGFNLVAEPSWVFTTNDPPAWIGIAAAPAAGRFAVRNTLLRSAVVDPEHVSTDDVRAQEVKVYNMRDGAELLRVPCSPAIRATQNFSLSPNGRSLAALDGSNLTIYSLPAPSKEDLRKLQQSAAAVHKHEESRTSPIHAVLTNRP